MNTERGNDLKRCLPHNGDDAVFAINGNGVDSEEAERATHLIDGSLKHFTTSAKVYWEEKRSSLARKWSEFSRANDYETLLEKANQFLQTAKSIPYLKDDMKQVVVGLETAVASLCPPTTHSITEHTSAQPAHSTAQPAHSTALLSTQEMLDQLSDDNRAMVSYVREDKRELFIRQTYQTQAALEAALAAARQKTAAATQKAAAATQKAEALEKMQELVDYLHAIEKATYCVYSALSSLSGLSQAEGATYTGDVGTGTQEAIEREIKKHKQASVQVKEPKRVNNEDLFCDVLGNPQDLESVLPLEVTDKQLKQRLCSLSAYLQDYLYRASFINHAANLSKAEYKKKVRKDVDEVYKQARGPLLRGELAGRQFAPKPSSSFCAPGAHAFAVEGTQQWLSAVVGLIGDCLQPTYQELPVAATNSDMNSLQVKISPVKNPTSFETVVQDPKAPSRPKRRCDLMLTKDGRRVVVVFDDCMQLGGVEKPGSRESQGPLKLFGEGMDQCLSHAAKSVAVGFNFAGPGVPTHATMFVVNMAAIQVLQLRLENVGTPDVKLVLYKSKIHPLMGVKQYDRWAASAKPARQQDFKQLRQELYGEKDNEGADCEEDMPSGYLVFCALMRKSRSELFGPRVIAKNNILGDVLGSGSFSVVFRHAKDATVAVKLPKSGKSGDLDNESKILHLLGNHGSLHVTRLFEAIKKLDVFFDNLEWRLPALMTTPVGLSSLVSCARAQGDNDKVPAAWLQSVLDGLLAALGLIHEKKIIHRDVNPSNIIICYDSNNQVVPVLNDFSIAFFVDDEGGKKAIGFNGTVNYTHREVFTNYPNKCHMPNQAHDRAALGFTMATFVNCGSVPWSPIVGFPKTLTEKNKGYFEAQVEARLESAIGTLDRLDQNSALAEQITELLQEDNIQSPVR